MEKPSVSSWPTVTATIWKILHLPEKILTEIEYIRIIIRYNVNEQTTRWMQLLRLNFLTFTKPSIIRK